MLPGVSQFSLIITMEGSVPLALRMVQLACFTQLERFRSNQMIKHLLTLTRWEPTTGADMPQISPPPSPNATLVPFPNTMTTKVAGEAP